MNASWKLLAKIYRLNQLALQRKLKQTTAERDEARDLVRLLHGSGVYHTNNQCRASVAMREWGGEPRGEKP